MTISVCIATYRRLDRLAAVLDDLSRQTLLPIEIVVVDNDADGSAAAVVEAHRRTSPPFALHYAVQPLKNIALTRNRTVEMAAGEWMAFIDDDERAPSDWLARLDAAAKAYAADGVLGRWTPWCPLRRHLDTPRQVLRFPRMATGMVVPPNRLRFGNVLLRGRLLREIEVCFDPAYGLTGGEDGDLLSRLALAGARIVWCDEAIVREPIEHSRLSLVWLLRRSLRGGQDFARHSLSGRYGPQGHGTHTAAGSCAAATDCRGDVDRSCVAFGSASCGPLAHQGQRESR